MDPSESPAMETETPLNQYEYQPIDSEDEMRILVLLPPASPEETELRCEITTANVSDKPSYEAISYCWGDEVFPETLHVSDGNLAITENLAAGLRRFRLKDRARRLWVDAVCINQHDDKEKGHQVALMAKIYRNADCVLVWLGEGSPAAHTGLECIRKLANSAWKFGLQYEGPTGRGLFNRAHEIRNKSADQMLGMVTSQFKLASELDLVSIYAFAGQDWFQRLWVVQEFVLASRAEIHNGQHVLSDRELSLAMAVIFLLSPRIRDFPEWLLLTVTLTTNRYLFFNISSNIHSHFLHYLLQATKRRCKLDQDRVYGLLGLLPDGTESFLEIDYDLSVEDVYTQLALIYLRRNNMEILDYVGGVLSGSHSTNSSTNERPQGLARSMLPSWAPDSEPSFYVLYNSSSTDINGTPSAHLEGYLETAHTLTAELGRGHVYSIMGGTAYQAATELLPLIFASASNTNVIAIDGLYLDVIETSLPASEDTIQLSLDEHINHPSGIARVVCFKETFTSKMMRSSYPTGEDQNLAFARCLLLDNKLVNTRDKLGTSLTAEKMLAMWEERYECFVDVNAVSISADTLNHPEDEGLDLRNDPYTYALFGVARWCSYFITKSGYIGVGPNTAMAGDVVAIFSGASTPFVLRKVELHDCSQATTSLTRDPDEQRWRIVGSCYIQGFMNNEVAGPEWDDKRQMIWIE